MRNGFDTLLQVVQNDEGYDLSFALQDSSGESLDITGATLTFKAQAESDRSVKFEGTMTIVDASAGKCKYITQATDFVIPGQWNAQVKVAFMTGEILTFTGIIVTVDAALPIS